MYYLKSESEEALWQALEAAGLAAKVYSEFDEEGNPVGDYDWQKVGEYDLDIIGAIFKPTGETGEDENGTYEIVEPIEGYHANIRGITEEQAESLPTIAAPNNPVRAWC